ncbi:MAG: hypothetical protein FJX52_14790 [Alphaproteobacteria bacterium]|nr:hypothetical protein [Alphaproteobacteria bacterium]
MTGWQSGLDKVALTRLLRDRAGLSLSRAKAAVDDLLAGHHVIIGIGRAASVAKMRRDIQALGVVATQNRIAD